MCLSVHYLVSQGANPDLSDKNGYTSRDIPMSLLAHNRHGVPVIQPQVLAAIEAGMVERGKMKKNVKRNAVERALVRFKSEREKKNTQRDRLERRSIHPVLILLFDLSLLSSLSFPSLFLPFFSPPGVPSVF